MGPLAFHRFPVSIYPGHVSVGAHGGLDLRGIEMKPEMKAELGRWGIPKIYEITIMLMLYHYYKDICYP